MSSESFWMDQGASGEESFVAADIASQAKTLSGLGGSALYTGTRDYQQWGRNNPGGTANS